MRFIIPDREICVEKIKIPSKERKIPALVLYPRQRPAQATGVLWIHNRDEGNGTYVKSR